MGTKEKGSEGNGKNKKIKIKIHARMQCIR